MIWTVCLTQKNKSFAASVELNKSKRLMLPFNELLAACESDTASTESSKRLVLTWINYSKPEEGIACNVQYNDMHLFGFGLAYMLSKYDALQIRHHRWEHLPEELSVYGRNITGYSCKQCLEFLRLLQAEYESVLLFDETVGFEAHIDMTLLLLVVMQRVGDHLRQELRMSKVEAQTHNVYELVVGETEWYVVSAQARKECFDILHVLMRLFFILLDAEAVAVHNDVVMKYVRELSAYQYEASLHDFYNFSMVSDCLPASILIYKHDFKEMFNDPSQVLYFHQPTYTRQRQVEFDSILSASAANINVLPLILQIKPDVPVLFEHTGACSSTACSAAPWSWILLHKNIVLCDKNGKYYVAKDIYVLFAFLMQQSDE